MNPLIFLGMAQTGIDLWRQVQELRAEGQGSAPATQAAAQAGVEYPELYKAALAYIIAVKGSRTSRAKVPEGVRVAEGALFKELAESYECLTGQPIPADVKAEWGG